MFAVDLKNLSKKDPFAKNIKDEVNHIMNSFEIFYDNNRNN